MNSFEKVTTALLSANLALTLTFGIISSIKLCSTDINTGSIASDSEEAVTSDNTDSTAEDTTSISDDSHVDASNYVTYFDLAYAAYTNPEKFLGKEITLVGYYSNNKSVDTEAPGETSESISYETESEPETTYHFITTYGQVDECHITAEFTTADGKYPAEIGTIIQITGKFSSYEEDGNTYYTIAADTYSTIDT